MDTSAGAGKKALGPLGSKFETEAKSKKGELSFGRTARRHEADCCYVADLSKL